MVIKARRAEKLSGGFPKNGEVKKEVQALAKVSRSVRGEPERVEEAEAQKLRARLDEFFSNLKDPSLPPINPIRALRETLGVSRHQMASTCYYSYTRWCGIEDGGISCLPNTFLEIVTGLFGPSASTDFERAWNRYRTSLSDEARREVERKLFPAGLGHMCP